MSAIKEAAIMLPQGISKFELVLTKVTPTDNVLFNSLLVKVKANTNSFQYPIN
jgi:hypothetical protein